MRSLCQPYHPMATTPRLTQSVRYSIQNKAGSISWLVLDFLIQRTEPLRETKQWRYISCWLDAWIFLPFPLSFKARWIRNINKVLAGELLKSLISGQINPNGSPELPSSMNCVTRGAFCQPLGRTITPNIRIPVGKIVRPSRLEAVILSIALSCVKRSQMSFERFYTFCWIGSATPDWLIIVFLRDVSYF